MRDTEAVAAASAASAAPRRRSRADVVAAALRILDDRGLADLTMRSLAAELGVQASALYWHFPNKQALLAAVADEIVAAASTSGGACAAAGAVDDKDDWRDRVARASLALRGALFSVKDGAEIVASTVALGYGQGRAHAYLADAVGDAVPAHADADLVAATLLHLILGHVSHEQQRLQAESSGAAIEAGAFTADAATFADGIRLVLDGVAHRTARHARW